MDHQSEIIDVSLDLFRAFEHSSLSTQLDENSPLHLKIKELLNRYTCFNQTPPHASSMDNTSAGGAPKYYNRDVSHHHAANINTPSNNNHHRRNNNHQHQHQSKYAQHGGQSARPQHLTKFTSGGGDKHLNGLLNKVTLQNYAVVRAKLGRMSMMHSAESIVSAILKKCLAFGSYAFLYHRLVDEFYQAQPEAVRDTILAFLDDVVDGLPLEISQLRYEPSSTTAYDDYCAYVKLKEALFSRIKTACMLDARYNQDQKTFDIRDVCFCALESDSLSNNDLSYIHLLTSILQIIHARDTVHHARLTSVFDKLQLQFLQLPMNTIFAWQRLLGL